MNKKNMFYQIFILVRQTGLLFLLFLILFSSACRKQPTFPLLEQKCGACHSATTVYQSRYDAEEWKKVLHGMKLRGLQLNQEQEQDIMRILTENFSRTTPN